MHDSFSDRAARNAYLEYISARYGNLTLPIGLTQHGLPLQAIFQPPTLRSHPLGAFDHLSEERRTQQGVSGQEDRHDEWDTQPAGDRHPDDPSEPPAPSVVVHSGAEALAQSPTKRLVILGGPGSGKTTLLKVLLAEQAQQASHDPTAPLPIFIPLPDLARAGTTLEQYLPGLMREFGLESSWAATMWETVQQGQAVLCLDSLDEVAPALRPEIITLLNRWARQSGGIWIIGSRYTEYKGGQFAPGQFTEWELQPLEPATRRELARRLVPVLYQLLPTTRSDVPPDAEIVVQAIETHPQAAAWGENPLLFSLAAAVHIQQGHLPISRAALYQQVLEAVLTIREPDPAERAVVLHLLAALALELHQAKGRTFTLAELLDLLPRITDGIQEPRARYTLAHRLLNTGLFEVIAQETYGFHHQTFQEYLAAVALAQGLVSQDATQQSAAWKLAWSKRTYSRWTEVLRMLVGALVRQHGTSGVETAWQWLEALAGQARTPEGDPGDLGLTLAMLSLSELGADDPDSCQEGELVVLGSEIGAIWARELLEALLHQHERRIPRLTALAEELRLLSASLLEGALTVFLEALSHEDWEVRRAGVKALGSLKARAPLAPVLAALHDVNADVRGAAIKALGKRGEAISGEVLLGALDDAFPVHMAALEAIREMGPLAPIQALVDRLRAPAVKTRRSALHALLGLSTLVPGEALTSLLSDPESTIRAAAASGLVRRGDQASLKAALLMLHDPDYHVRYSLYYALIERKAPPPLEVVQIALKEQHQNMRNLARSLMWKLDPQDAIPLLTALREQQPEMRLIATFSLAKLGVQEAMAEILSWFSDPEPQVRRRAAEMVERLDAQVPIRVLIAALKDTDRQVRRYSIRALGHQGRREGAEALLAALDDSDWSVRIAAVEALVPLGVLNEREHVERLLEVLGESHPGIRCNAAMVLGALGEHAPLETLLVGLRDSEASVRAATAQALARLGERVPVEVLVDLLSDSSEVVRIQAIAVLGEQGKRAPVERLAEMVADSAPKVRQQALETLGKLGKRAPVDVLIGALTDQDPQVRRTAVDALGALGEDAPLEPLLSLLEERDEFLLYRVLIALGHLGRRAPVQRLREALSDERRLVREGALCGIGHLGEHAPLDLFIEALQQQDWGVRICGMLRKVPSHLLGQLGQWVPVEPLIALFHTSEGDRRRAMLRVLAEAGTRVPIDAFLTALQEADAEIKEIAAQALGARGDETPLEPLLALLGSDNPRLRAVAVKALEQLGSRVPLEPFLSAAQDRDWSVWMQSARALAKRGRNEWIEMLVSALGEGNVDAVEEVIQVLEELGERTPVEPLLLALGNTEQRIARAALVTLSRTHPEALLSVASEAAAILHGERGGAILGSSALSFTGWTLREAKRTPPLLLEKLTAFLDWPYWQVRARAAEALGEIRRSIPGAAIRRLLDLRHDPQSRAVREADDEALTSILSLETGIEDE